MEGSPNSTPAASLPAGIANAFRFQFFNGLSFSIIIGAPALLFFKNMGASATVLGIVVALTTRDFIKHAFAGIPARALPWLFRRRNSPGMN